MIFVHVDARDLWRILFWGYCA